MNTDVYTGADGALLLSAPQTREGEVAQAVLDQHELTAVGRVQAQLSQICMAPSSMPDYNPGVNTVCCARFTVDNEWYRARVKSRSNGKYVHTR